MSQKFPELYGTPVPDCKLFTGFKPCEPYKECRTCQDPVPIGTRILIINFESMGDILVNTSFLPALKRKFPESQITWLTLTKNRALLYNNPYIDHLSLYDYDERLFLLAQEFDVLINIDKSDRAASIAVKMKAREKLGFGLNRNGALIPLNPEATYLYQLGLSDDLKFKKNKRTMSEILHEMCRLEFRRDEMVLNLTSEEKQKAARMKSELGIKDGETVVGINTGSNVLFPNKKLSEDQYLELIEMLARIPKVRVVLFGGPEDADRNARLADAVGYKVISTPTNLGLRNGIVMIDIADIVISGDAMGLYAGIALKKYVIAWFGPTCWEEVDLYDRGIKIIPDGLACSPCWKKECPYGTECISEIRLSAIAEAVQARVRDLKPVKA